MTSHRDEILERLAFAIRRDSEKGGDGWRTTREVADWLGVDTSIARRTLDELADQGLVGKGDPIEGMGRTFLWHLADPVADPAIDEADRAAIGSGGDASRTRLSP